MTKRISIVLLSFLMLVVILASCGGAIEISVRFVVDGETYHTVSTTGESAIAMPKSPTKEGYVFDGWYWDNNTFQKPFTANSLLNQELSGDMSVYAKWIKEDVTKKTYDLTFNSMGGSDVALQSVLYGNVASAPKNPTKSGYIFVGWYKEADLTTKWNFSADTVTENTTLYAKWVAENDAQGSYIVEAPSFEINDRALSLEIPNAQEHVVISDLITVSPYATYKVTTDIEGVNEIPSGTVPVSVGDNTFYILVTSGTGSNKTQYTVNVHRRLMLNVTYSFNNGSENVVEDFEEDSKITVKEASKAGYTFTEWKYNGTAWDFENGVILENMILEATYTANEYTVSFNSNGGTDVENTTVTFDAQFTFEVPEKNGYTFDGWRTAQGDLITNELGVGKSAWTIADDTALFAQWTPVGYEITYYNVEGATNNNAPTYDVEDEPLALVDASKTGYTFLGWYDADDNKITEIAVGTTGNLDLYAKWKAIEYTATFMDGENEVGKITFTVETESFNEPSVPEHTGYTGVWESYTLGANDITVNAVYTPIVYTIIYEGTKGADNSNPVTYTIESDTITLVEISANGYTFKGWTMDGEAITEIPQGSTGNVTLTADWTAIKYSITYMYDAEIGDYADENKNPLTYTIEDEFDFIALVNKTTGYTFDGWYTEKNVGTGTKVNGIEKGSTGDITIYAQWALKEYTITYHNANGVTNTNAKTYTVETDTFEIFDISRNGYTFDGWYDADDNKITEIIKGSTGNIDLYAKWTPMEYTIEYVLYGGTYAQGVTNPSKYTIEDKITFNAPVLDGYTFVGFFTLAEGGECVTEITEGTTGNKTLYARYIAFDTNGGGDVEYELIISGDKISKPSDPKIDYYTFDGWYTDEALTNEFDFSIPTKTLTLYAKFVPTVYKITYVLNGGTNPQNQVLEYTIRDTVVTLLDPTKTGYTFVGWFTDDKFTSSVVTELENEHGDKTFYANYKINQYTISFNSNGGTEVKAITQNYATNVVAPSSPAKNGYKFEGWYSDSALKNEYTFTTMPAGDITLYAKWTLEAYKITYNLDGGENNKNNPSSFTVESNDITLQAPSKTGYKFVGWYSDSEYKNAVTKIAKGTYNNVELYAKWEIITYSITYVTADGTQNANPTVYTVETDLAYLADATLKGHTFSGWYKDSAYRTRVYQIGGGETGNITLYAKFSANTYDAWLDGTDEASFDVSFDLNGGSGSIAKQTITEANTLKYPSVPTRNGYVFGGWYSDKDCAGDLYDFTALITSDITLYAKWVKADKAISVNSNVTVTLSGREEQKFTFVPLVNGNVTFTTIGSYDTLGTLYDEDGNVLKLDDDTGSDGINFQIVFNVTAGEVYTISVSSYSSATNGTSTLYVSGSNTVDAGGYVITGNKTQVIYGSDFTIDMPTAREGYKFLGWADKNGTMYTDGTGASVKAWDKDETTLLVSVWERTVYTVTFVTSGGSSLEPVTLAYGDRLDISKYVTTRENYTFDCWMYEGAEFEATTMPDHDITLTAKWKTFALGEIKYDTTKLSVSVNDEITAELFGALCLDTNGQKATFTVTVSGTQVAGKTISVRLVAKSGNKTKQVTITGVKVYGAPTLVFDEDVDYVNLIGGMTAEHFQASGTDSFGNATEIKVYIEGDYKAGDIVTVTIESVDPSGNVTKGYVENVKAYGLPEITYNENKTAISVNDTINADLFDASAKDSFGNHLTVTVSKHSGTISAGNTVTVRISATDSKGNVKNIDISCKVYGAPTISSATKTNIKATDNITASLLGITAKDTYNQPLDVVISVKSGEQKSGTAMVVTATATDIAGNVTTKDITLKVYGTPTISYDREGIKLNESVTASALKATATDSFGASLTVSVQLKSGSVASKGTYVVYTLTATDVAGNTYSVDTAPLGVYDVNDVKNSFTYNEYMSDLAKLSSDGSEFDASATDTFGNACTITIEASDGTQLKGGQTTSVVLVATDIAGNRVVSNVLDNYGDGIKIYDNPIFILNKDGYYVEEGEDVSFLFIAYDSFGQELYTEISYEGTFEGGNIINITAIATDDASNTAIQTYSVAVISNEYVAYIALYVDGVSYSSQFVDSLYKFPVIEDIRTFAGWVDANGTIYADANGNPLQEITGNLELFAIFEYKFISTKQELINISMDGKYILTNDIDLGGVEWEPIGTLYTPFTGTLNGNGYVISNFEIITESRQCAGLIGYNSGKIMNLGIANFTIEVLYSEYRNSTSCFAGGIVGMNSSGTITNCYATGNITAKAETSEGYCTAYAGGLVGMNSSGTITNCYAMGNITAKASSYYSSCTAYAGGLVGTNSSGTITNCYAMGNITAGSGSSYNRGGCDSNAGGLVGWNIGTITNCYATADIHASANGDIYAGGLVGTNSSGIIMNCYATGYVKADYSLEGKSYAGGLVGRNLSGATITNCYATGNVRSSSYDVAYAGGLVGDNAGTITNCYCNNSQYFVVEKIKPGTHTTTNTATNTSGTAIDMTQIQSVIFYTSTLGWTRDDWNFVEGQYPILK